MALFVLSAHLECMNGREFNVPKLVVVCILISIYMYARVYVLTQKPECRTKLRAKSP